MPPPDHRNRPQDNTEAVPKRARWWLLGLAATLVLLLPRFVILIELASRNARTAVSLIVLITILLWLIPKPRRSRR